ncbi:MULTISPECIES: class Ib ribonucleoside-diphosphate reductase assembly flavoprotein NrdI [unclassified Paenibacillus]|uniref:class Ib ribonucleoside-diphosphate reductase assembly flavoprotein NrdI n=1 Tax=unclassified Paenibacillus TaxID=185978 RepID=UPI0001663C6B|nr:MULTISPECIES: class Ib ribonucleoside-diphosphate reductase assembly flavoprotein NrdI [unclassified Paenibacillus]ACT02642.1 NrdI protein [Paenibacillus sp. JDR-2]NIK68311.1 protein involved in ribonucleotide reduction [Paenibacillus sp. BK720]TCM99475.1 protein involved in ribonucleotide reduction [Paenibacillus sp. BK033]
MLVVYDSRTGNVKRFINKLNMRAVPIGELDIVDEPYVLVTYTTGFGQVPERVMNFLNRNSNNLQGVSASGNRNWGDGFAKSADTISSLFNVPVLSKFELSGTNQDMEYFVERVRNIETHRAEQRIDATRSGRLLSIG